MQDNQHGSETESLQERAPPVDGKGSVERSGAIARSRSTGQASFASPKRWVPRRKAEVVDAVQNGLLTLDQACERYALSLEEFLVWQHDVALFGLAGLRMYKTQPRKQGEYRGIGDSADADGYPHRRAERRPTRAT